MVEARRVCECIYSNRQTFFFLSPHQQPLQEPTTCFTVYLQANDPITPGAFEVIWNGLDKDTIKVSITSLYWEYLLHMLMTTIQKYNLLSKTQK